MSRRTLSSLVVVALAIGATLALPSAAAAAPGDTNLLVVTEQATGTATWDALDANATNTDIRTNDTISYTVSVRNEPAAGNGAATNPVISFTVPKGQEIASLPTDCLNAPTVPVSSSVVPSTLNTLSIPLTSTSWNNFTPQVVTCYLANRSASSTTVDYIFVTKVRSEVPDGTVMDPFVAHVSAAQMPAGVDTTPLPAVTVRSTPLYDLSKNGMNLGSTQNGHVAVDTVACTNPAYASAGLTGCQTLRYPILISVQAAGKGTTPLSTPITFDDDLTPLAFFGATQIARPGWDEDFAPSIVGCGRVTDLDTGASVFPYGAGTSGGSVTNSGTISCVANSQGLTQITITNADTTANHYPTTNGTFNVAVPVDRAYIVSGWVKVEFPVAAIQAIGTLNGVSNVWQIAYRNEYKNLAGTAISGAALPNPEPNVANNYRAGNTEIAMGGGFGKTYTGEPGNATNSGGNGYSAGQWAGPVGSGNGRDGQGIVQAGSRVTSLVTRNSVSPPGFGQGVQIVCDAWDNTKAALTARQWRALSAGTDPVASPAAPYGTVGYLQQRASNGAAVWLSSGTVTTFTVEYLEATGSLVAANGCIDTQAGWVADPTTIASNDAALELTGIYTGVGAVRITYTTPGDLATRTETTAAFSIGLTVLDTVAVDDIIGNWAASKYLLSETTTAPTLTATYAATGTQRYVSTYVPGTHGGILGDRITVQIAVARIIKEVRNPLTGLFTGSAVPVYETGDAVTYRLSPSLTAGITTGATSETYIEDCLPLYQNFVSSRFEAGAALVPDVNQLGAPLGATLACAADRTYLRWNLGAITVNSVMPKITYEVAIDALAPSGNFINDARITADGDTSLAAARSDTAQIQIDTSPGIRITKEALTPTVEVNPAGATSPRTVSWEVRFAVIDTSTVSSPEVIDVLPSDGRLGSNFEGDLNLQSVVATATTGTPTVLYTSNASSSLNGDPKHASNLAGGATVWCSAPVGGSIVSGAGGACPTSLSDVTGLRVRQLSTVTAGYQMTITVTMVPVDNADGDVYNNTAEANANGVLQGVGPVADPIDIVASSVGNYVWVDANKNGVQDAGERPVSGLPVNLVGTDPDGNAVSVSTTTNASGLYLFDDIPSGDYTIEFDKAWVDSHRYTFTTLSAPSDILVDSDADPTTGFTTLFVLGFDADRLDLDAGLVVDPVVPPVIPPSLAITGAAIAGPLTVAWLLGVVGFVLLITTRNRTLSRGRRRA
jgi:hypothetical protein